jgi:hypothetical protein
MTQSSRDPNYIPYGLTEFVPNVSYREKFGVIEMPEERFSREAIYSVVDERGGVFVGRPNRGQEVVILFLNKCGMKGADARTKHALIYRKLTDSGVKTIDAIQAANKETGLNLCVRTAQRTIEKLKPMDSHIDGGANPSALA